MKSCLQVFGAVTLGLVLSGATSLGATAAVNRLTYLDDFCEPYHPTKDFAKLATPQWVGEPGVEVVVTYGIDDMSNVQGYENFLRPMLHRLALIDGRAPVSIFSNSPRVEEPRLQQWLKEGLTFEVHTLSHPCPTLAQHQFGAAVNTVHGGIDLLNHIPGNAPVAFRTPCCDSMDSASPRLFAEILASTNAAGQFIRMDSSVAMVLTTNDSSLPGKLLVDDTGRPRFQKYVPFPAFTTTIENYPYPYVHTRFLWEMPFVVPSDWQSQNLQGNSHPRLLEDWKAALDLIALKQGTFNYIFHPASWSAPTQHVAFIDYAVSRYGAKVKFLNYREVHDRLTQNLLAGQPLRAANGGDNGVRLLDLNHDGFLDVVIGNDQLQGTRIWNPTQRSWRETSFPARIVHQGEHQGVRFGLLDADTVVVIVRNPAGAGAWRWVDGEWQADDALLNGLTLEGKPVLTAEAGKDRGVRLRDVDHDGFGELVVGNASQNGVFSWDRNGRAWRLASFALPAKARVVNQQGEDQGLRLVDLNEDGVDDVVCSNEDHYSVHLMVPEPVLGFVRGWSREVIAGQRGQLPEVPMIVRPGAARNNGAWFARREMWVQNEDVAHLPNIVQRVPFGDLLNGFQSPALSPAESWAAIQVPTNFVVELVASEPVVQDPVYLSWGDDGTLWVVEMRDYPLGVDGKPGGVIKTLKDRDGDGRYDEAVVFADHLSFPNGLLPWRKGVIISAAPNVLYAEDTNGDGKADRIEPLFQGFALWNQQHLLNGFEYGLDNWIYGANGDSGGNVHSLRAGTTVSISGRDFRLQPDTGAFEAIAGQTQFGRYRDDWGNWFGNANPVWLWHYWLPDHYVKRNSRLAVDSLRRETAVYPDAGRVFPVGRKQPKMNDVGATGHVTSANSPTPYRDELFGPEFAHAVFVSEPVHNLIRCELLQEQGVSFTSTRWNAAEPRDFLTSRDTWTRPTGMKIGPDGALYFADMYRQFIEHPEWIPEDLKRRVNLRAGEDKGRIYRVYPKGSRLRPAPDLARLATAELAGAMDSVNGWQRDTVQRMLVSRADRTAEAPLRRLLTQAVNPKVRLQALCTLDGLSVVQVADLVAGLQDTHPTVREHSVRISERFLKVMGLGSGTGPLSDAEQSRFAGALLARVEDSALRVRFQLALSLGDWSDARAAQALAKLAVQNAGQPDLLTAVLTSVGARPSEVFQALLDAGGDLAPLERLTSHLSRWIAVQGDPEAVNRLINQLSGSAARTGAWTPWQISAFAQLLQELEKGKRAWTEFPAIGQTLPQLLRGSRTLVTQETHALADRLAAIGLLGRDPASEREDAETLSQLLLPRVAPALQAGALGRLGQLTCDEVASAILRHWRELSPGMRQQSLEVVLRRETWRNALLDRLEHGEIAAADLGASTRQRLVSLPNDAFRARARKLLDQPLNQERQRVVAEYLPRVQAARGNAQRGAALFGQHCATCHRLGGQGQGAAPDLASVVDRSPERMLIAVFDPNRAVEDRYLNYVARTRSGEEVSGLLVTENANSVTLVNPSGVRENILRTELESLTSTRQSVMPEGFEQWIKPEDFADLLAHLDASSLPSRRFAGNQPALVQPEADGALHCRATAAEIYGAGIAFEAPYQNLGSWNDGAARAVWTVEVPLRGAYDVWLHWACHDNEAGDGFRVQLGDQGVSGRVPGTRTWDDYEARSFGRLELAAGKQRLVFQAEPPLRGYLIDLAEVRLVPASNATPRFVPPDLLGDRARK